MKRIRWFKAVYLAACLGLGAQSGQAEFRVGLVLDRGGKDDRSFNSSAYEGGREAEVGEAPRFGIISDDRKTIP